MRDEMFDRDYQAARAEMNQSFAWLASTVMSAFEALNDIEFQAPWRREACRPTDA